MDPVDFVRPRALLDAVSRSPEPMRRANQPEGANAVPRPGSTWVKKLITSTVRTAQSTPCVEGARKSTPPSVGVPREYVEFGAESAPLGLPPCRQWFS